MKKEVSLWQIFTVFAKIGAFTIGGGYAMIPIIQAEMSKRGWISDDDLPDIVALSQSAPGVMAVNISIFAGHKLRGIKGSIAATLGSITPSFLIILAIAMFFTAFKDNPWVERAFKGIRPVVISLIAVPMINMARKSCKTWWAWLLAIGALILVAFLNVSPIYIIICVMVVGFSVTYFRPEHKKGVKTCAEEEKSAPRAQKGGKNVREE
jgi:chromate transporter